MLKPIKLSLNKCQGKANAKLGGIMTKKDNLRGVLLMLANALVMTILYATNKHLVKDLNSSLVVFIYKFLVMVAVIPLVIRGGGFHTNVMHLHFIRGIFSVVGSLFYFYALKHINLTDATALGYLEQVLLMIIGMLFFGERIATSKIFAIFLALLGAFCIVYKDIIYFDENGALRAFDHMPINSLNEYHILLFIAIIVWACNRTLVKILGRTERTEVQLFYVSFFSVIVAFPWAFCQTVDATLFGLISLKMPTNILAWEELGLHLEHWNFFLLLVLCYGAHSVFTFKALQCADLSIVAPFEYSRLIFSAILAYILFNEQHNISVYTGCVLIIASGVLMVTSERRWQKKQKRVEQLQEQTV